MKILALEFSSDERAVAAGEFREGSVSVFAECAERGTTGIALVDRTLKKAGLVRAEIGLIAVALGPGSYGGVRSAIALALGWELARGTPLAGISSFDVLARQLETSGVAGTISIIVNAQRQECYRAEFEIAPGASRQIRPVEIVPASAAGLPAAGPGASRLVAGALDLNPSAAALLALAAGRTERTPAERLEPIYLRETSFVKAPPPRFS